jgi:glycosyltransferase involved in cell wall biosynthesis
MKNQPKKTVWIINDYAGSPSHGMTYRHYYMAKELQKKNINPIIISASYSHFLNTYPPIQKNQPYLKEMVDKVEYLWLKVIKYKDSRDKKRVWKWFQFSFKLFNLPKILTKPDIILCSGSAPMLILPSYYLAKKYRAKLIFEIRDIWPLTLMNFQGYSKYNPLMYIMQKCVNFGFKHADHITSVLPNTDNYIREQGIYNFDFTYLPNGIFLEELKNPDPLNPQARAEVPKDKFIIGYTGAMGMGDRLDLLIDVAQELKTTSKIHFVLVGKGSEKERLRERIKELKLTNMTIIDAIPKKEVQNMLALFDVCYIGWEDKSIYKYGISANKIFDYMYSAKPIIHLFSGEGDLISKAQCGITIKEHKSSLISQAILKLYNTPQERRKAMGIKGKNFVLEHHTYSKITDKFLDIFSTKKEPQKALFRSVP